MLCRSRRQHPLLLYLLNLSLATVIRTILNWAESVWNDDWRRNNFDKNNIYLINTCVPRQLLLISVVAGGCHHSQPRLWLRFNPQTSHRSVILKRKQYGQELLSFRQHVQVPQKCTLHLSIFYYLRIRLPWQSRHVIIVVSLCNKACSRLIEGFSLSTTNFVSIFMSAVIAILTALVCRFIEALFSAYLKYPAHL